MTRTERSEDVGNSIKLVQVYDGRLFRSCVVRNASERRITESQFADDGALLASTRPGAEKAVLEEYQQTSRRFGSQANISKTKYMIIVRLAEEQDLEPVTLDK